MLALTQQLFPTFIEWCKLGKLMFNYCWMLHIKSKIKGHFGSFSKGNESFAQVLSREEQWFVHDNNAFRWLCLFYAQKDWVHGFTFKCITLIKALTPRSCLQNSLWNIDDSSNVCLLVPMALQRNHAPKL
jgi:hypothetical protein